MTVTLTDLPRDEQGQHRVMASATLGEGTKVSLGIHPDLEAARELAQHKGLADERWLAANETHTIDELAGISPQGHRVLRAPDGQVVEATEATVDALLAAGYREADVTVEPLVEREPVSPKAAQRRRAQRKREHEAERNGAGMDADVQAGDEASDEMD